MKAWFIAYDIAKPIYTDNKATIYETKWKQYMKYSITCFKDGGNRPTVTFFF